MTNEKRPKVPETGPNSKGSQPSLFDEPGGKGRKGPVRLAYERQVRRLKAHGQLDGQSETLVEVCRNLADGLDVAKRRLDPYAMTAVARELRESLAALEPMKTDDDLAEFLDQLRSPLGDTPSP